MKSAAVLLSLTLSNFFLALLSVSTNPAQSIEGEQTMTNIQREIKVKCQNMGPVTKSRPWTSCVR